MLIDDVLAEDERFAPTGSKAAQASAPPVPRSA